MGVAFLCKKIDIFMKFLKYILYILKIRWLISISMILYMYKGGHRMDIYVIMQVLILFGAIFLGVRLGGMASVTLAALVSCC